MTTARDLLLAFTASSFRDPQVAAEMFAEDGAFELPYLASFGFDGSYVGRPAIAGFFSFVRDLYLGFEFENVKILIDTPVQVFAEYEFRATSTKTGRAVHHLFSVVWLPKTARSSFFGKRSTRWRWHGLFMHRVFPNCPGTIEGKVRNLDGNELIGRIRNSNVSRYRPSYCPDPPAFLIDICSVKAHRERSVTGALRLVWL